MKNKEWLKNEIEIMGSEASENYPHEQMVGIELVLKLIDQLDEPVKAVIPQFVADWISQAKKWGYSISDSMKHVGSYFGTTQYDKAVYWANKNQDIFARAWFDGYEVEKVVIPQFVAEFIEDSRNKVGCIVTAIWEMYEFEYERVYEWALQDGNDEVLMKAFVNGYEIEKEKLYVVELNNDHLTNYLAYDLVDNVFFISRTQEEILNKFKKRFTEQEIKNYDERFWPFAVEVAE